MGLSDSISRIADYYSRHGFRVTIQRAGLAFRRAFFANRMVVFYCDLAGQGSRAVNIPSHLKIDRLKNEAELSPQDLQKVTSFWNPEQARRNIRHRFDKGASLWLIRSQEALAGFGWTLQGSTIEPYYLSLGQDDVHLFDFHVFPEFRGQGMNPLLVTQILLTLGENCGGRAFIDAAEWNRTQLSSLQKTPFRRLGLAKSFTVFGRTFVSWSKDQIVVPIRLGRGANGRGDYNRGAA